MALIGGDKSEEEKPQQPARQITNQESFSFFKFLCQKLDSIMGRDSVWSNIHKIGLKKAEEYRRHGAIMGLQTASDYFGARRDFWKERKLEAEEEKETLQQVPSGTMLEVDGIEIPVEDRIEDLKETIERAERAMAGWQEEDRRTINKAVELKLPDMSRSKIMALEEKKDVFVVAGEEEVERRE